MRVTARVRLSNLVALTADGAPPDRFRLFTPGWNVTEKGKFLFDAQAAKDVLAARAAWGVDCMIDLEHQALNAQIPADPTARDARGWCQLELAADGSLWAVGVKWTPDGAERLSQKRQRYVSPAFEIDPETKRIVSLTNIAITALPATHHTPALVAADAREGTMDPKLIAAALEALTAGDAEKCTEILKSFIAAAASGEAGEQGPPSSSAPGAIAAGAGAAAPGAPPEKKEDVVAASTRLMRLTGAKSFVEAVATVDTYRTSHLELETGRQALATERATFEAAERRKICAELVTLGAQFPHTIWADDKSTTLKPIWADMPIVALRQHLADQRKARGKDKTKTEQSGVRPPAAAAGADDATGETTVVTPHGTVTLSVREVAYCKDAGAKLDEYAANKAIRQSSAAPRQV